MANEQKWTPGEWSVPHFAQPDVNCSCGYVLTDHLMGAICTVHASGEGDDWQKSGDNPKFQEAVANAYLIAASPRMYEAMPDLSAVISWLENGCDPKEAAKELLIYAKRIDSAKAKARGES